MLPRTDLQPDVTLHPDVVFSVGVVVQPSGPITVSDGHTVDIAKAARFRDFGSSLCSASIRLRLGDD